ncbi:hypothetical protein [Mycolicibacterium sp. CH28]|nr:hypothetical protein [Mycolicibacterium sp. CH28]
MRILVTGATGYVGSRLVDQGRDIVAATRDPLRTGPDLLVKAHRP